MCRPISYSRGGFTLVELVLSMLLFGVGVGALLHTSVLTVRMMVRGRQAARAVQAASAQLEALRAAARLPPGYCAALSGGADTLPGGTTRQWRIGAGAGPLAATVTVLTAVPGGYREDTLSTVLPCP